MLSPWIIYPNIGDKQEGLPSAQFQSLLAVPPGRHERIKEEGVTGALRSEGGLALSKLGLTYGGLKDM
ncbi:hypothetical protein O181_112214, partial [Austropuccinia psidii MF-1]|nr:hypothetical protein [Austropuccinia psidii MF-1]